MSGRRGRPQTSVARSITKCSVSDVHSVHISDPFACQLLDAGTPPFVIDIHTLFSSFVASSLALATNPAAFGETFGLAPWSLTLFTYIWDIARTGAVLSSFSLTSDASFAISSVLSAAWMLPAAAAEHASLCASEFAETLLTAAAIFATYFTHAWIATITALPPSREATSACVASLAADIVAACGEVLIDAARRNPPSHPGIGGAARAAAAALVALGTYVSASPSSVAVAVAGGGCATLMAWTSSVAAASASRTLRAARETVAAITRAYAQPAGQPTAV